MSQSKTKSENGTASKGQSIPPTLTVADLSKRLQAKTEQNRQEIEQIISTSMQTLTASLSRSAKKELSIINRDIKAQAQVIEQTLSQALNQIERQAQQLRKHRRRWPLVLSALGIISATVAGTITLQAIWIQKDLAAKQTAIKVMNQTLETSKAWGIQMSETANGNFLILPPGATLKTGYILKDGREAAEIKGR